jgi:hypothetical protein
MSKYLMNKFLYTVDRDPELVERYREDPRGTVEWWEAERANVILNVPTAEKSSWLKLSDDEREALATHDYPALFGLGAHPFLTPCSSGTTPSPSASSSSTPGGSPTTRSRTPTSPPEDPTGKIMDRWIHPGVYSDPLSSRSAVGGPLGRGLRRAVASD